MTTFNNSLDPLYLEEFLTEEEKNIKKTANQFCCNELEPIVIEANLQGSFNKTLFKKLGSLGFLGMTINGFNAANSSNVAYGLVAREFEAIDSSYRSALSVQSSLVIKPIYEFGSDLQKKKYLPELVKGNLVGCFGLTESEAGSDPSSLKTSFIEVSDGYIINGTKTWITNAPIADLLLIWAFSKEKKIHGFLIDKNTQGLSISTINNKLSLKISPTGQINLSNVKIPKENKLPNTKGWSSVFSCLNSARYGISWGVIGAAEKCFSIVNNYVDERKMFNKKLSSKQLIQKKLAVMQIEITIALSALLHTGRSLDKKKDMRAAISILKMNNCKKALEIIRESRDMLGANGILEEYNIMRHLVNLEAVKTYEGTEDIHSLILGKIITGIDAF